MSTHRRDFIKFVVAGALAAACPIDRSLVALSSEEKAEVEGEHHTLCHQVRDGKIFSRPSVSARHDVVIIGGGISGLAAAYMLQSRDVLLLEKESHWGGNAYLLEYGGQAYATGTAFVQTSEAGGQFAKEIGMTMFPVDNWDGSIINGEFVPDTWGEGLDKLPYPPAVRDSFKKLRRDLLAIDFGKRAQELYNIPLTNLLKGYAPEVKAWWDTYGRSNWGAASEDTAAAAAVHDLQWFAGDNRKDDRVSWPGGVGALTRRLAEILHPKLGDRMQTGATTVAVVPQDREVHVTYLQDGAAKTVGAKAIILATPKFITSRIVQGLPEKQSDAMRKIRYIPYPVVNLIFDKAVFHKGYDSWCPGNAFTDLVVADWVVRNQPGYRQKYNILTCYAPMAEEERGYLLAEISTRKIAERVLGNFQKLFPGSNVDPVEVHIYRRGHPMYMAAPGLFTEIQPLARQPFDRIFFANTDSEALVSDTSGSIAAARRAVRELEHRLSGRPAGIKETAAVAG